MAATISPSEYSLEHALPATPQPQSLASFVLDAAPGTDLWRKPSKTPVESDNAPRLITNIPASSFKSAQVTVEADWTRLYDQGGIILVFPPNGDLGKSAWIKTGIELYNNKANLSTVATPALGTSDWSVMPVEHAMVTLLVEREADHGPSLWVYRVLGDEKIPLREITWVCTNILWFGDCLDRSFVVLALRRRPGRPTSPNRSIRCKANHVQS